MPKICRWGNSLGLRLPKEIASAAGLVSGALVRVRFNVNSLYIFADWAAARLKSLALGDIVLVPVPSHRCVDFEYESAPVRMARMLATLSQRTATVEQWLKFSHVMPASHESGGRDAATIAAALQASPDVRACNVVLIDDVKTSGAHIRACAGVLRRAGARVEVALVAGSTTQTPVDDPLQIAPVDLENQAGLFDSLFK